MGHLHATGHVHSSMYMWISPMQWYCSCESCVSYCVCYLPANNLGNISTKNHNIVTACLTFYGAYFPTWDSIGEKKLYNLPNICIHVFWLKIKYWVYLRFDLWPRFVQALLQIDTVFPRLWEAEQFWTVLGSHNNFKTDSSSLASIRHGLDRKSVV